MENFITHMGGEMELHGKACWLLSLFVHGLCMGCCSPVRTQSGPEEGSKRIGWLWLRNGSRKGLSTWCRLRSC